MHTTPTPAHSRPRPDAGPTVLFRAPDQGTLRSFVAASVGAVVVLGLAGCANALDAVHQVHSEAFSDHAAAERGWVGVTMPEWIPDDAEGIQTTATNDETNAVIAVEGGTTPVGCEEGERRALPFDGRYGGFTSGDELPDAVLQCGPYEIVETETGWLGWFVATEAGQTPDDV